MKAHVDYLTSSFVKWLNTPSRILHSKAFSAPRMLQDSFLSLDFIPVDSYSHLLVGLACIGALGCNRDPQPFPKCVCHQLLWIDKLALCTSLAGQQVAC